MKAAFETGALLLFATALSLLPAGAFAGTQVTSPGTTITPTLVGSTTVNTITPARAITWSDYLGVNTDFTDLTNPLAFPTTYKSMTYVGQEISLLQQLGLKWVREPIRWDLVDKLNPDGTQDYATYFDPNVTPIYTALTGANLNLNYYVEGAPCWAAGVQITSPRPVHGCALNTGVVTTGTTDTVPPMADLGQLTAFYQHLNQIMPNVNVWEVWNEQNTSGFWQRVSYLTPYQNYYATTLSSDYLQLFSAAAAGLPPGKAVSSGGWAYQGEMDCKLISLPEGCISNFYSNYPQDTHACPTTPITQTSCSYPTPTAALEIAAYRWHMLNGLAMSWSTSPPPVAQFHPYFDFEPGEGNNAQSTEDYMLGIVSHTTSQLRGQEPINTSSTSTNNPSTWVNVPNVVAGEFGVSAQTYASNSSLCGSWAYGNALACGEYYQAKYGIRHIIMSAVMDFNRVMMFMLGDAPDSAYVTSGPGSGNINYHYGLLRVDGLQAPGQGSSYVPPTSPQAKPLYNVLQRFLQVTGTNVTPMAPPVPSSTSGFKRMYSIAWLKPNGKHIWVFWGPDQTGTVTLTGIASATLHQIVPPAPGTGTPTDTILTAAGGNLTVPVQDDIQVLEW